MINQSIRQKKILNISVLNVSQKDLLRVLNSGFLFTPNIDHLVKLQKDKEFYEVYQNADWIICDSKITALGLRFLGTPIKEIIPGSSFFPVYCNYHKNDDNVKIFLLGAAEGVAVKAMQCINERTGRNIVIGAHSPSFGFENNERECEDIVRLINATDATVLVVGVGAPKIFQRLGLEWFYRLLKEPRRLWKRYLVDDMVFFYYLLKQKLGTYKNPFEDSCP
jgi:UDP-N-acetyl-D-mannosaminuronic acid transferase (WecB/TagA/CpsF family)